MKYTGLKEETEGLITAAQDQALNTRYYSKHIIKQGSTDRCRMCHTQAESVEHIISGCQTLAADKYLNRHNQVAAQLHLDICVVPPQSWGDRSDTKHSKCLLLGGQRLNQLTLIPKPKGSGGARAATAQVGPANKRNDTKRCLPIEASLRPGEAVPW